MSSDRKRIDRDAKQSDISLQGETALDVGNIVAFHRPTAQVAVNDDALSKPELGAGFYTWDLSDDVLRGDPSVARLFGFDEAEVDQGMPVMPYIDRIAEEDRGAVAEIVSNAIKTGSPYQASYRIVRPDGSSTVVAAYAHLFRNSSNPDGTWVGLVQPLPDDTDKDSLILQCLTAYTSAVSAGQEKVAAKLREALGELIHAGN